MLTGIKFEMTARIAKGNYWLWQLFNMKRCFGANASLGIVDPPDSPKARIVGASSTTNYRLPSQMVIDGLIPKKYEGLDHYFNRIPSVYQYRDSKF